MTFFVSLTFFLDEVCVFDLLWGSMYHVNYFQRRWNQALKGNLTEGLSVNVNVTTTGWGGALGHTTIDNDATVQTRILQGFSGPVDLNHSGLTGLTNR